MITTTLASPLAAILANPGAVPLTIGSAAATELGITALDYLEGASTDDDVRALILYAARHDETAPARDALVAVLLDASGTLRRALMQLARAEIMNADWGGGRETAGLTTDPDVAAVPRRQALAERLMAERARRLRPQVFVVIAAILADGGEATAVPTRFLERNWIDLRDALVQRVRSDALHREQIARWLATRPPAVRGWLAPIDVALIDVATQAILHTPERAPLAPFCGEDRVAEGVRTAVTFRGEPARARLGKYLARLTPGTEWYETIRAMMVPPPTPWKL